MNLRGGRNRVVIAVHAKAYCARQSAPQDGRAPARGVAQQRAFGSPLWLQGHLPALRSVDGEVAPARGDGQALDRRLWLESGRGCLDQIGKMDQSGPWPGLEQAAAARDDAAYQKAPHKTVERLPVGWRSNGHSEALYGCKVIFRPFGAPTDSKRQPAGTGRRSTGAFGLIPVGRRGSAGRKG